MKYYAVGDHVMSNGYEGTILQLETGVLTGMATVTFPGGQSCVSLRDLTAAEGIGGNIMTRVEVLGPKPGGAIGPDGEEWVAFLSPEGRPLQGGWVWAATKAEAEKVAAQWRAAYAR